MRLQFSLQTHGMRRSRPCLSGAVNAVLEAGQLFGADRTARMKFSGGNSDFRAEAEFTAIGELGRSVVQHDRRIDLVEESSRNAGVFSYDRVGVMRTVLLNVRDRPGDAIDDLGRDDRVFIFGVPILVGSGPDARIGALHGVVAA